MSVDPLEPPSLITLQIRDIKKMIENPAGNELPLLDVPLMENEGYVTRERLGPPAPRTPWYPEGKPVTSKEFNNICRLLADISQLTLVPTEEYSRLSEFENRHDYTEILRDIRGLITQLLITFIERHDVKTARMRIFDDLKVLVKETWEDVEQLMFRTGALADMFQPQLRDLALSFNNLLPTYREGEDVKCAMSIETSYQANFSMRVGTCYMACLLTYNEQLKETGAKDPRLRFDKDYKKRHPYERYYLSEKFIEDLAFTAYILNIGLYHASNDPVLQMILTDKPPPPAQLDEIRKKTYETTMEIINAHTILDLPVGRALLKILMTGEMPDPTSSSVLNDPNIIEMLRVCMDYFTLTSQRPYRNRYHSSQVIEHIGTQLGALYNIEAADIFFSILHPFPPGQILTLNDAATHTPLYLVKVLDYTEYERHPQFRSMPIVRVLAARPGAPALGPEGAPVDLSRRHLSETAFNAGELVFMGSEQQGAFFLAQVVDPAAYRVKFIRCVTLQIPKEKADAVIGKMLDIPPGNPQRRLWKCHASLYLADTVPSQSGNIINC